MPCGLWPFVPPTPALPPGACPPPAPLGPLVAFVLPVLLELSESLKIPVLAVVVGHGGKAGGGDSARQQALRARHFPVVQIEQGHLLECGVTDAADDLARGIDVDEAPGAVVRLHGIFDGRGAQEMNVGHAGLEIVDGLRIMPRLVIVEADGASPLIAAPDGLLFALAAALRDQILEDHLRADDHREDDAHGQDVGVAGLRRTPRVPASLFRGVAVAHCCSPVGG